MFQLVSMLFLAAVPTPGADPVAGLYQSHQMEIGAALELRSDGHFRYQLDYGAVSETAAGTWTSDGQSVRLTSNPMPREPDFALVEDKRATGCGVSVSVDWNKLDWSTQPRLLVTYQGDPKIYLVHADENGKLESPRCKATSVRPLVPVYGTIGTAVKLTPGEGHKLTFRFQPNDIGQAAFRDERLVRDANLLVLERYQTSIRFIRVRP